jgi:hypothetical protein
VYYKKVSLTSPIRVWTGNVKAFASLAWKMSLDGHAIPGVRSYAERSELGAECEQCSAHMTRSTVARIHTVLLLRA